MTTPDQDRNRSLRISNCFLLLAILPACQPVQTRVASSSKPAGHEAQVRAVLSRALPSLDGGRLKATVIEVTYSASGFSRPHRHPCPVIGYVIEGALRTAVDQRPETIIHAGETFYEAPNGLHRVSANASANAPVRFLAVFMCDNDQPLSVADPSVE